MFLNWLPGFLRVGESDLNDGRFARATSLKESVFLTRGKEAADLGPPDLRSGSFQEQPPSCLPNQKCINEGLRIDSLSVQAAHLYLFRTFLTYCKYLVTQSWTSCLHHWLDWKWTDGADHVILNDDMRWSLVLPVSRSHTHQSFHILLFLLKLRRDDQMFISVCVCVSTSTHRRSPFTLFRRSAITHVTATFCTPPLRPLSRSFKSCLPLVALM